MECRNCKFWQGTKYSEWGDCYRVISQLDDDITSCYLANEYGTIERFFSVPFDPHEVKYWIRSPSFLKIYGKIGDKLPFLGVRVEIVRKDDIVYDTKNGERTGKLKLKFFQTHKDYSCKED